MYSLRRILISLHSPKFFLIKDTHMFDTTSFMINDSELHSLDLINTPDELQEHNQITNCQGNETNQNDQLELDSNNNSMNQNNCMNNQGLLINNTSDENSNYHCPRRKTNIKRDKFLPSEDKLIIDLVKTFGPDWTRVSLSFGPTRTKRQLRERWQNYLNPSCDPNYTIEEDELLCELVNELGQKWAKIASKIGNKSAISCRNRHRVLMKMQQKGIPIQSAHLSDINSEIITENGVESIIDNVSFVDQQNVSECSFDTSSNVSQCSSPTHDSTPSCSPFAGDCNEDDNEGYAIDSAEFSLEVSEDSFFLPYLSESEQVELYGFSTFDVFDEY
ncbi:hypothetical protein TRFO_07304 [Tritrichomonas foetus]|uniref:Myb-like DNA-binding domain containing protein n=1 Tax=Tritrichomonas foetus TaxID=1144522 RepID=A0A1J4JTN4_9EUKA|nr:hypothetical protein TRFO_07304 [Tritrichomonas foetus]|eukprot:OHT02106.1 hypothetical protein TRFO_07304 [Tritrichomonas foetus]